MENVKVADEKVNRLRKIISFTQAKFVPISVVELVEYLECFERLAALERHLYNLTSNSYAQKKHAS